MKNQFEKRLQQLDEPEGLQRITETLQLLAQISEILSETIKQTSEMVRKFGVKIGEDE